MKRNIFLLMILSLAPSTPAISAQSVVDLALEGVGRGTVAEMQSRIFSLPFAVYGESDFRSAVTALPKSMRASRITEGKLWRRVERVISPVLELHNRSNKLELFLYQDHFPRALVWRGCVLVISDCLAKTLYDNELAGIVAHEMAHAYFMNETVAARQQRDESAMRVVELKCDAVAMLTLKVMGLNPAECFRGLQRMTEFAKRNRYSPINSWDHPSLRERELLAQRFTKLLG